MRSSAGHHLKARAVGKGGGDCPLPSDFGRSVNPITTEGGQIMPTRLLLAPRIFRPSYGLESESYLDTFCRVLSWSLLIYIRIVLKRKSYERFRKLSKVWTLLWETEIWAWPSKCLWVCTTYVHSYTTLNTHMGILWEMNKKILCQVMPEDGKKQFRVSELTQ